MKKILILTTSLFMLCVSGFAQKAKKDTTQHATFYTCPMHPDVKMTEAGKCPQCGMELTLSKKEQMKAKDAKTYRCPVHVEVTKAHPGKCPKCGKKMTGSLKEQMKAKDAKLYTCPMHPEVALESDGTCPKCGMKLEEKKE